MILSAGTAVAVLLRNGFTFCLELYLACNNKFCKCTKRASKVRHEHGKLTPIANTAARVVCLPKVRHPLWQVGVSCCLQKEPEQAYT